MVKARKGKQISPLFNLWSITSVFDGHPSMCALELAGNWFRVYLKTVGISSSTLATFERIKQFG